MMKELASTAEDLASAEGEVGSVVMRKHFQLRAGPIWGGNTMVVFICKDFGMVD